jgi:hypothetical protein
MRAFNPVSLEAFEQLLARPDPKDLPRRAHVLRWAGEPNRRSTRLLPIVMGWLQQRFLEADIQEPLVPAARTKRGAHVTAPGPRLLRRAGTERPAQTSSEFEGVRSLPGRLFIDEESEQPHPGRSRLFNL